MNKFNTHGGYFSPKGYTRVNEGGSHEENPNGGVQMGVDGNGTPNLLEENEPVYNDFVYSDNINADEALLAKYNLPSSYSGLLYSEIADKILQEAEERPNDPISNNGLNALLVRLANAQEEQKKLKEEAELQEMLSQLSPEELEQLEMELSQDEVAQEAAQHAEEPLPPMVQMANGGLLRTFDDGGEFSDVIDGSKTIAYLPEPNTAAGNQYAHRFAQRIANGQATLDTIPQKYRNYVEGLIAPGGSYDVARAINKNATEAAIEALSVPAEVIGGAELLGSAANVPVKTFLKNLFTKKGATVAKTKAKAKASTQMARMSHEATVAKAKAKDLAREEARAAAKSHLEDARVLKSAAKDDLQTAAENYTNAILNQKKLLLKNASKQTLKTADKKVAQAEKLLMEKDKTYKAMRSVSREAWRENLGAQAGRVGRGLLNSVNPYASFSHVSNPLLATGSAIAQTGFDLSIPLYGFGMFRGNSEDEGRNVTPEEIARFNQTVPELNFNDEAQSSKNDGFYSIEEIDSLFGRGGKLFKKGGNANPLGYDYTTLPAATPITLADNMNAALNSTIIPVVEEEPELNFNDEAMPTIVDNGIDSTDINDYFAEITPHEKYAALYGKTEPMKGMPAEMYASPFINALTSGFNALQPADRFNIRRAKAHPFYVPPLNLQRQTYEPIDQNLVYNAASAQHNAAMRGYRNAGLGLSATPVMMAADNGFIQSIGNPLMSVRQQNNQEQNQAVAANNQARMAENESISRYGRFNSADARETDLFNIQREYAQQQANAQALQDKYSAISKPLYSTAEDLYKIARQKMIYNMIASNPALLYGYSDNNGNISYKGSKGGLLKKCK